MSANTIIIRKLYRTPGSSPGDEMVFTPGVNLIVGEKDSGKTKWLSMLDYIMGETAKPEDVFGDELAQKYDTVSAEVEIAGESMRLERRWKEEGGKSKVFVDGVAFHSPDFSEFILKRLNIPLLNFPKGDPYAERSWPSLSWRMLLRHIYRQERFWTDFADKQPPGEQHACIAQFLAAALSLFPPKLGELIKTQKVLYEIQARKDAHVQLLNSITAELVQQKEMSVGVTETSLDEAEIRLKKENDGLMQRRTGLLTEFERKVQTTVDHETNQRRMELQRLRLERDAILKERDKVSRRETELRDYLNVLSAEIERLERVKTSGQIFADLKVTQCPVCDQDVDPQQGKPGTCFLCHKPLPHADTNAAARRLSFEEDQLREEAGELVQLVRTLQSSVQESDKRLDAIDSAVQRIDSELQAARQVVATLIPEDLVLIDREAGRLNEQMEFLKRVRKTLQLQKRLVDQINECQEAETKLKAQLAAETPEVNLEEISSHFQDRMLDYLNRITEGDPKRWTYGPVNFRLRQRDFQVKVRGGKWNAQIGATSQALVLFAYHYAMLSLVADKQFNYPGLVIIDFPLELADGASIADKENYLVEPFIELCKKPGMEKTQFIAAGRAFENLPGSNQLHLMRD